MKSDAGETIALKALAWLAANDDLMGVFLGSSGAAARDVATMADDPAFLGSVLDFLVMDDAWIVAFCDAEGLSYDTPLRARAALPGGDAVHWT